MIQIISETRETKYFRKKNIDIVQNTVITQSDFCLFYGQEIEEQGAVSCFEYSSIGRHVDLAS